MDKNYVVTKSNYFIMNSSYDLSLEEQKIILTLASMVQPSDEEFKPYKFRISEFMELVGVEDKSKYTEIPKITKELMKKVFEIEEGKTLIQTAWLSGTKYEKGTGMVELTFSPYLKPYMLKLNSMFTQYKLANILSMKSKYSPRVYEILKCNEFKKQGYIEIEIVDLRKLLKAESVYPKYNDFKRYIVQRTQKELKKISDISFDFEEIKTGRKVTALRFYIKSNIKAKNEIAATKVDAVAEAPKEFKENKYIEKVKAIMYDHEITSLEAKKVYDSSKGDFELIDKVYKDFKTKQVGNFVGAMISMVKPGVYNAPKGNDKKIRFNDYEQRDFDPTMEAGLLGWNQEE
jgi:plasmid replication initiation protein